MKKMYELYDDFGQVCIGSFEFCLNELKEWFSDHGEGCEIYSAQERDEALQEIMDQQDSKQIDVYGFVISELEEVA